MLLLCFHFGALQVAVRAWRECFPSLEGGAGDHSELWVVLSPGVWLCLASVGLSISFDSGNVQREMEQRAVPHRMQLEVEVLSLHTAPMAGD